MAGAMIPYQNAKESYSFPETVKEKIVEGRTHAVSGWDEISLC